LLQAIFAPIFFNRDRLGDAAVSGWQRFQVNDFWKLYNFVMKPSELQGGCTYHVFKESIKPMWEDPINRKGGQWQMEIKNAADDFWQNLVRIPCRRSFRREMRCVQSSRCIRGNHLFLLCIRLRLYVDSDIWNTCSLICG